MSTSSAVSVLNELRESARSRWSSTYGGKTLVVAQVANCSQSVGASEVAAALEESLPESAHLVRAGCDGACCDSPQVLVTDPSNITTRFTHVSPESAGEIAAQIASGTLSGGQPYDGSLNGQTRVAMDGCGELHATSLDQYLLRDGYGSLARALSMSPEEVIEEVKAAGLRGRGGAYFPVAAKWEAVRKGTKTPKYVVVNAEEGEPGIFKDRHLLEGVPHRILEGAIVASYASGAEVAYVYINAEASLSATRVRTAVEEAYGNGLLGKDILGTGHNLEVEVRLGAGGYVCGEETTLLNTTEGRRREPRIRPPFPTEAGLWGGPTVINNVETLANVPFIFSHGAEAFAQIGSDEAAGTKVVSLSGSIRRPGLVEVPMGTTLREVIYDLGQGPPPGRTLTAVAIGGPSSGVLPLSMLDTSLKPGPLHESGVMLGAGGVIAIDDSLGVLEVVRNLAAYNAAESCGKCTPCREGTPRMVDALDQLMAGYGSAEKMDELKYLAEVVGLASLCGLGQAAGAPINSMLHFFSDELPVQAGVS